LSGNGKDTKFSSQSTEDEEQKKPLMIKCWVCEQDVLATGDDDLDQASKVALIVANAFVLSRFGNLIQLQEIDRLFTKKGVLKGWMARLMAVMPHQDVKQRLLGRHEVFHDIGKIMFGFDYQVVPARSSTRNEVISNLKKGRRIKTKSTRKELQKAVARQRKKMKGGVMKNA